MKIERIKILHIYTNNVKINKIIIVYVDIERNMDNIESIVNHAQQGEEEAFRQLYDEFHKKCYYTALKVCNYCEADAQDVVQDTFFEIHRSIGNLRDPKYFKTWMTRILISKCSHKFRDNKNIYVDPEVLTRIERYTEKRMYMVPGKSLNDESDKGILLHLVDELKPKQKEVILLQYFHNLSLQEIADVLEIPIGTVKSRSMYARNELALKVQNFEKEEGRKLGFQAESMGALLAAAFAHEFQLQAGVRLSALGLLKSKGVLLSNQATNVLIASGIAIASVITSVGCYQLYQNHQNEAQVETLVNNDIKVESNKKVFQTISYQDSKIDSCRNAYYTLKEWAPNAKALNEKSWDDKEKIRPVYEELKYYQGVYWEKLVKENWTNEFDS